VKNKCTTGNFESQEKNIFLPVRLVKNFFW